MQQRKLHPLPELPIDEQMELALPGATLDRRWRSDPGIGGEMLDLLDYADDLTEVQGASTAEESEAEGSNPQVGSASILSGTKSNAIQGTIGGTADQELSIDHSSGVHGGSAAASGNMSESHHGLHISGKQGDGDGGGDGDILSRQRGRFRTLSW